MPAYCDRSSCSNSADWYANVPAHGEYTFRCDFHAKSADPGLDWRHVLSGLPMAPKASAVLRFLIHVWPYGKTHTGLQRPIEIRHLDLGYNQASPTIYQDCRAGQYGIRWEDFGKAFRLLGRYKRLRNYVLDKQLREEALALGLTGEEWL